MSAISYETRDLKTAEQIVVSDSLGINSIGNVVSAIASAITAARDEERKERDKMLASRDKEHDRHSQEMYEQSQRLNKEIARLNLLNQHFAATNQELAEEKNRLTTTCDTLAARNKDAWKVVTDFEDTCVEQTKTILDERKHSINQKEELARLTLKVREQQKELDFREGCIVSQAELISEYQCNPRKSITSSTPGAEFIQHAAYFHIPLANIRAITEEAVLHNPPYPRLKTLRLIVECPDPK